MKTIPVAVQSAYKLHGKPFALIMRLDGQVYVEVSAKTAMVFKRLLQAWVAETLPTLYRSDVRVFLAIKEDPKEVTLIRLRNILK